MLRRPAPSGAAPVRAIVTGAVHDGPFMTHPGLALRRMRALRGMKQSHLAEVLGVTQATVSRWERGIGAPEGAQAAALERMLAAPTAPGSDAALKRLVARSPDPVHLVCDLTHRLLAVSPARTAEWLAPAETFIGERLFRFASDEIRAWEARLPDLGWYDLAAPRVVFHTGANRDAELRILPGWMAWERIRLEDGSLARLVSPADPAPDVPPGNGAACIF